MSGYYVLRCFTFGVLTIHLILLCIGVHQKTPSYHKSNGQLEKFKAESPY